SVRPLVGGVVAGSRRGGRAKHARRACQVYSQRDGPLEDADRCRRITPGVATASDGPLSRAGRYPGRAIRDSPFAPYGLTLGSPAGSGGVGCEWDGGSDDGNESSSALSSSLSMSFLLFSRSGRPPRSVGCRSSALSRCLRIRLRSAAMVILPDLTHLGENA